MKEQLEVEDLTSPCQEVPGKKLLLVDDNMEELLYYTAVLQHLGYEVRPCASYADAAGRLGREHFELVIVNQGGTSFEGRTVLARALETDRNTPVLVLTRLPNMECYIEAMQLGAFDYMEKPLALSEIADLVRNHIRSTAPVRGYETPRRAVRGMAH